MHHKLDRHSLLTYMALGACFFSLGVIALGAFTRLIDAGLGCPDWPGCYGHMIPSLEKTGQFIPYKAWAEMIHRYFVGGLSFLILVMVGMIFSKKDYRLRHNMILASGLILLLGYQIMLGQWTVTLKLLPIIVTQHLLGGFLILATLWLIYLTNRVTPQRKKSHPNYFILVFGTIGIILVLLQILLGAWTSTHYASLSCPDFPFCQNDQPWMPLYFKEAFTLFSPIGVNYEGGVLSTALRQTIQMAHRIGAVLLTCYLLIFFMYAVIKFKKRPEVMKSFYCIVGLLCIQLCLGMGNVIFKLPWFIAVSHTLVAALLFLSLITVLVASYDE